MRTSISVFDFLLGVCFVILFGWALGIVIAALIEPIQLLERL